MSDPGNLQNGLEIYDMPGHLIRRLHQISVSIFLETAAAAGHDITQVQYAAMKAIEAYPGLDQATLAGAIAYDRVTIGGVVDRLEQKALVRRQASPHDKRAKCVFLEPAGRQLLAALDPLVHQAQDLMLAGLEPAERASFLALLRKATEAVNDRGRAAFRPVRARTSELAAGQ